MRTAVIIFAVLFFCNCTGKRNNQSGNTINDVGQLNGSTNETIAIDNDIINQLHVKYQKFKKEYYNDLNCLGLGVVNPKAFNFQIITDTVTKKALKIKNIEEQEYIVPMFWKPDYVVFYMPVIHISDKYYEVKANKTMSIFVQKEEVNFYTWEDLFKKAITTIEVREGYAMKDIDSDIVFDEEENSDGDISLIVEKIDGDWFFIRAESDGKVIKHFWAPWKKGNKLLIEPIFLD